MSDQPPGQPLEQREQKPEASLVPASGHHSLPPVVITVRVSHGTEAFCLVLYVRLKFWCLLNYRVYTSYSIIYCITLN